MALTATIYKAQIELTHIDSHIYESINLTIAKHPSETEARMMFRLLAYLYCYSEKLEFTKGISTTEEPDIWLKNYSGDIELWIELGFPEPKRIKQALARSSKVIVFTYQPNRVSEWETKISAQSFSPERFQAFHFTSDDGALEALAERTMELSCIIEDGNITLANAKEHALVRVKNYTNP